MPLTFGQALSEMTGDPAPAAVADDVRVLALPRGGAARWEPEGGSAAGAARVLGPFAFAFDTPGINDGISIHTPVVGDVLLDCLIVVTTLFDGSTPRADVGNFTAGAFGWFGAENAPVGLGATNLSASDDPDSYVQAAVLPPGGSTSSLSSMFLGLGTGTQPGIGLPYVYVAENPIKIVVSQDGTLGGDPIAATQGAGNVYLVVATPSLT